MTASFSVDDGDDYVIPDDMTATLTIMRAIAVPTAKPNLVYTAAEQTGVAVGEGYTLSGDVTGIDAGTNYTTIVILDDYNVWSDGSTDDVEVVWSISPAPLTVTAKNCWKLVGTADPAAFEYEVDGLQGNDTADNVLTGRLVRVEGEELGTYLIMRGTLDVVETNPNYRIGTFNMGEFQILAEEPVPPVPTRLPELDDPSAVAQALTDSNIADDAVAEAINNAADPLAAYTAFRNWALTVDGGVDAACDSEHAYVSYEFGVTEVFENEPAVTFTAIAIEDPSEAAMRVTLVVTDGGVEKTVDADKVAELFEMSADLSTWTDKLTASANSDGSYTVKPEDSAQPAAFIRLSY